MYNHTSTTLGKLRLNSIRSSFLKAFYSCLVLLFVGILLPSGLYAQTNDVVTNQTIVQLTRAGIGKQIIYAKIDNSVCSFDVSTDGLIDLKKNGVPDDIVAAMIAKNNSANQPQATDQGQNQISQPNIDTTASVAVTATTAPPELPTYEQPPCPTDGYLWMPGYWAFNRYNGYFWVPGSWVAPPNPGLLWTPAYWGFVGGVYRFHHGYWGASVGFYGGINYGYGYAGVGFVGGGWHGSSFRYNTAVVNVNTTVIHNTYVDRTVIVNNTTVNNRTSFNGAGGVTARPRPEEVAAMHAPHVQPTSEQLSHQQAAATDKNQFARVNNGHPAAAAVARPNTFTGGSNLNHNNNGGASNAPAGGANRAATNAATPNQPAGGTNRAATNATTTNQPAGNKTPTTNNNRQNNRQARPSKPARQPRNNNKKDKN